MYHSEICRGGSGNTIQTIHQFWEGNIDKRLIQANLADFANTHSSLHSQSLKFLAQVRNSLHIASLIEFATRLICFKNLASYLEAREF